MASKSTDDYIKRVNHSIELWPYDNWLVCQRARKVSSCIWCFIAAVIFWPTYGFRIGLIWDSVGHLADMPTPLGITTLPSSLFATQLIPTTPGWQTFCIECYQTILPTICLKCHIKYILVLTMPCDNISWCLAYWDDDSRQLYLLTFTGSLQ